MFERQGKPSLIHRWWFWIGVAVLAALVIQFAPWPPAWADAVFLGTTLPAWSALSSRLTDLSGRSLSALLLLGLVVAVALALLAGGRARAAGLRILGGFVALLALSFPFVFGLGYRTTPLEARLAPDAHAPAPIAGNGLVRNGLAGNGLDGTGARRQARQTVLAALRESVPPAAASARGASAEAAAACLASYLPNVLEEPLATLPSRVKAVPEGALLRLGFAGVVSPWLLEPHIDPALPPPSALAVALHELAHSAGFAREAEAEAVGLLAGLACENEEVRYAAALRAASTFADELPAAQRQAYLGSWPARARTDVALAAAVAADYRWRFAAKVASDVYDSYLSSQGMEGISDYARATDLLVLALTTSGP